MATRLRLDIAYDGTAFHGWAKQPGLRTVQGEIESAIQQLVRSDEPSQLTVGGRTDAGVHARGQVAHLDVSSMDLRNWLRSEYQEDLLSVEVMQRRLNGVLHRSAEDAQILRISRVPGAFDARFSALWRRYEYRLADTTSFVDPLTRHFTVTTERVVDAQLLARASAMLVGLRDFSSFCKPREGSTAIRTLQQFEWTQERTGVFVASIQADAFCHSMVRALVGAVTAVATGRISLEELDQIAEARARTSRFAVMPAHGLSLEEIAYPPEDELGERAEATRARRERLDS